MQIGIIGTGRMALNLGKGWAEAGHAIVFGSRNPENKRDVVAAVKDSTVTTPAQALEAAEVVVLAIPYLRVELFAHDYAAQLQGKVIIDITNPFDNRPDDCLAGAEITAQAIGPGARVVAAFKDNFWDTLLTPVDPDTGLARDVHFAGDGAADKQIVSQLVEDLGFRPVDCGPLKNARVLDGMVPLIVELDRRYANGERRSSWKLLA